MDLNTTQDSDFLDHINVDAHLYGSLAVWFQKEVVKRGNYKGVKTEIVRDALKLLKDKTD